MSVPSTRPQPEAPTIELVLKRNPVERLKREKGPLGMLDELPALIAAGYADVAEEDVVRLKWWGLYHDKPKVGTFMLRIKLAAGRLTAPQLRAIGQPLARPRQGRGRADHTPERAAAPPPARRAARGVRAAARSGAHEPRRLRRHGARDHGLPGRRDRGGRALRRDARARRGAPRSSRATPTTSTCPASTRSRSRPAPRAATRRRSTASRSSECCATGSRASRVLVGGGLSSVPRIARDLGVFVRPDEAIAGAARDPRHVARRSPLARLARQVADEVHGRRARARGRPGRGRAAPRVRAAVVRAAADRRRTGRSPRHAHADATGGRASACPSTSGCSAAPGSSRSATSSSRSARRRASRGSRTSCSPNIPAADVDAVVAALAELELPARAQRASRERDRLHRASRTATTR